MVMGQHRGLGSTSLVNNILRASQHVVHVDHFLTQLSFDTDKSETLSSTGGTDHLDQQLRSNHPSSCHFTEFQASTRILPTWRYQRTRQELSPASYQKPSVGDRALDRNLTFIDCPSADRGGAIQAVLDYVSESLQRTAQLESMSDTEIVRLLSGDGGDHVTAILYLFDPESSEDPMSGLSLTHQDMLFRLSKYTNLIPLISKADTVSPEALQLRKHQISTMLELIQVTPYRIMESSGNAGPLDPLAVSFLPGDDSDTIDASVLMSSQYLAPLYPSELGHLVENLVEPENLARMRYESSLRSLAWREENLGHLREQQRMSHLLVPQLGYQLTDLASDGSFPESSSKAMVPHSASSFGRSGSPSVSAKLPCLEAATGSSALARYNEQAQPTEPFRQVRLAKWAKDLQNSLQNQSRRYQTICQPQQADWALNEDNSDHALVATKDGPRAARGHLGGEVAVIDPRDPLGILAIAQAFRRRGFLVVQLVGGWGLIGAVFYCVAKSWPDIAELVGFPRSTAMGLTTALAPPVSREHGPIMRWLADANLLDWRRQ